MYVYTYMHIATTNEKRDEIKKDEGGVHGKIWRKKREKYIIILKSQKIKEIEKKSDLSCLPLKSPYNFQDLQGTPLSHWL